MTGGGNAGRSQDSGGTSGNNEKLTVKKNNKKESNNNKVTINKKKEQPKKKEGKSKAQLDWEKKSRNSPARKSKKFTDKELWDLQKEYRRKYKNKRGW